MNENGENDIRNGYASIGGKRTPFAERVINDRIKITLPEEYEHMEKRHIKAKYPGFKSKDAVVLTSKDTTVNFMFDFKEGTVLQGELEEVRDQLLGILEEAQPSLVFLDKSTIEGEGLKVAYFEIVTPSLDKAMYNFMYFFATEENLVVASFSCYDDEKDDWRLVMRQIAGSITACGI
ncbi:MAG: hypothetical protein FWG42_11545 [Clostridiales bacterium]|nr:hypothetical protein [Clostridiales bacterium]